MSNINESFKVKVTPEAIAGRVNFRKIGCWRNN